MLLAMGVPRMAPATPRRSVHSWEGLMPDLVPADLESAALVMINSFKEIALFLQPFV